MKLDQAIRLALEYEKRVYQIYCEAMEKTEDQCAKRILRVLCEEEKQHLSYLENRLQEWQQTGKLGIKNLETAIPSAEVIQKSLRDMKEKLKPEPSRPAGELELLKKALEAEIQASNFYRDMVRRLDGEAQQMFGRFLEIEDGHTAMVQGEIDSLNKLGFWFDFAEFRLENQ